jgi:hypothetical protein
MIPRKVKTLKGFPHYSGLSIVCIFPGKNSQEKRYKTIYGSGWFSEDETQKNSGEGG